MNTFFPSKAIYNSYRPVLLKAFSQSGAKFTLPKGALISCDGEVNNYVYLICSGCISHSFVDENGNVRILLLLSTGDVFGEITLLQEDEDKVITTAITPVILKRINKIEFFDILKTNPTYTKAIMQLHSTKIRILMAQIKDTAYCNISQRLYNLLLRLAHQHGTSVPSGIRIKYPFTHEDFSQMLGSTRSTITRELSKLEKEGKICKVHRHIIVMHCK